MSVLFHSSFLKQQKVRNSTFQCIYPLSGAAWQPVYSEQAAATVIYHNPIQQAKFDMLHIRFSVEINFTNGRKIEQEMDFASS